MLISIFTPTHDPTHLEDAYRSILRQSWTNWEWVLVPNGDKACIPDCIRQDRRVRIAYAGSESRVGALKQFACNRAKGDALIELGHDDLLMPGNTLAVVAERIHRGVGFLYSDVASFQSDLKPHAWDPVFGWETYPITIYGRKLLASRAFPPTPRALCEASCAPWHIRCWSREAYRAAGGYDLAAPADCDHDLVCRTYLTNLPFEHTGGCHYLHRLPTTAAALPHVEINRQKYLGRLIRAWCHKERLPFVNMSSIVRTGWKFDRDLVSGFGYDVGAISCIDLLHLCPPQLVTTFMNQVWRSLVPGGYLEILVPSTDSRAAFTDPRAKSFFNYTSFFPYTRKVFACDPEIACRFQYVQHFDVWLSAFHKEHGLKYVTIHLSALKGQRQPGTKHI